MATCVVLGGAGFIGSHLVEALLSAGHRVRIFDRPHVDRLAELGSRPGIETYTGDFVNAQALRPALAGADVVYHLVPTTLPKTSNDNPAYDVESNVIGTLRVLELCRAQGVRRMVFVSSGGTVYGVPQSTAIDERHPTDPICSYGVHKLAIEKYLQLARTLYGVDHCILRPANLYGPRQRLDIAQGAVAVFLDRALRREPIEIWGDGSVVRDYVYVADAVGALVKALDYGGSQRIFNIGSGQGVSLNELVAHIGRLLGRAPEVRYASARTLDVPANVLDCSAAGRHLGWRASTRLEEGLRRTYEWMRSSRG
jgi:UDP-glucose 4-epimerase